MGLCAIPGQNNWERCISEGRNMMLSLFGVALDVANMGGDLHGSVWFWPEAAVDCAVQRGLDILDK